MKYKGYTGVVEFDEDSGTLFGHVIGLRDGITFQGDSVAEVVQAFHDSVDDYLEFCAERGESPEKPYSGQFVLRIDPQLHRVMSHAAEERGASLNSLIEERLKEAFGFAGSTGSAFGKALPRARAAERVRGRPVIIPQEGVRAVARKGPGPKPGASSPKSRSPKSSKGSAPVKGSKI